MRKSTWVKNTVIGLVIMAMLISTGCELFNRAPEIESLTASSTSVAPGGSCTITCTATDPDGDTLTYTWSTTGGAISGTGNAVTWIAPTGEGSYTITAAVGDGTGSAVSDSITIDVVNTPPKINSVTPSETNVAPESSCDIDCTASDADGDTLTYAWTASDGTISGTGSTVAWEAPANEGNYTISVTVSDGKGGTDSGSCTVEVEMKFGSINVESSPTGAAVYLDGVDTGNITPYVLTNVTPGDHNIKLVMYHYKYREQTVEVNANETTYVNWSLTYAAEQVLTIQPGPSAGKDSFVYDNMPADNYASGNYLIAGSRAAGYLRTYIQFDLDSVPDDAVIANARLELYYFSTVTTHAANIGVYAVTEPWNEGDITWDNQPSFAGTPDYVYNLPASATNNFVYWYIGDLVRGWWDGNITNHGVVLKVPDESSWPAWKYFSSSDEASSTHRPKLVIYYYDPIS